MADLDQNTNPTMNNSENTNAEVVLNNDSNPGETVETTEKNLNFSEMFSENPSNNVETDKNYVFNNTDGETLENPEQKPTQEVPELNTSEDPNNSTSENLNSTQESETVNNEIILGKFDNPMINSTGEREVSPTIDPSLLEHPAILENSPSEEANAEEQQKAKLAQKEKLLQLIKTHESKAQKSGFIKGILSGVVLTACIVVAGCFFAKDQVVDFLNNLGGEQAPLSANIVNLSEDLNEDIENTDVEEDLNEDTENTDVEEDLNEDTENTDVEEDLNEDTENTDNEEDLDEDTENTDVEKDLDEDTENTDVEEDLNEDTENTDNEEDLDEDTENTDVEEDLNEDTENTDNEEDLNEDTENTDVEKNDNPYKITYVYSEEKANWVLPSHCSDLTCYGEDKEFTPCTTFRLSKNLDENANRIGKNGVCKYKDPSELVYVEL